MNWLKGPTSKNIEITYLNPPDKYSRCCNFTIDLYIGGTKMVFVQLLYIPIILSSLFGELIAA